MDLHASSLLHPSSSNPADKVPKEALELGIIGGNPALGANGEDVSALQRNNFNF
jgi:hypothetical protein